MLLRTGFAQLAGYTRDAQRNGELSVTTQADNLWRLEMFICQDDKGGQALHLLADKVLQQAYVHTCL